MPIRRQLEEALRSPAVVRGCPFHNAAVAAVVEMPEVARLPGQHKQAFRDRLITAAEVGVADATALARQFAVIYEGPPRWPPHATTPRVADDARPSRHPAQGSPPKAR